MESWLLYTLIAIIVIIILSGIKIIDQYERGVVLTLGSFTGVLNPGLRIVIPIIQRLIKVDMRITTLDIPQQEVITKDNVPVGINAVVYFQVEKPDDAVLKIQDFSYAIMQYAQTALRDVIGGVELDTLLTEREKLAEQIKAIVDKETDQWGVNMTSIKMQDITLPQDMKRVMAKQAEAERERRATIIRAEGERSAAKNLKEAMEIMDRSGAISLRTLQTIESTNTNPQSTVIFTLPTEILAGLKQFLKR
ncbi:slipin family protein [Candidatus Daviesbacteria bacterium]|nr:slipin family protein [Candidatus Daviesbacteria bacterium]